MQIAKGYEMTNVLVVKDHSEAIKSGQSDLKQLGEEIQSKWFEISISWHSWATKQNATAAALRQTPQPQKELLDEVSVMSQFQLGTPQGDHQ